MKAFFEILLIVLFFIAILSMAFIGTYFLKKKSCLVAYENFQPSFALFSDCRIMVEGNLTPVDIVRELK